MGNMMGNPPFPSMGGSQFPHGFAPPPGLKPSGPADIGIMGGPNFGGAPFIANPMMQPPA